jgi:hypothetical protein
LDLVVESVETSLRWLLGDITNVAAAKPPRPRGETDSCSLELEFARGRPPPRGSSRSNALLGDIDAATTGDAEGEIDVVEFMIQGKPENDIRRGAGDVRHTSLLLLLLLLLSSSWMMILSVEGTRDAEVLEGAVEAEVVVVVEVVVVDAVGELSHCLAAAVGDDDGDVVVEVVVVVVAWGDLGVVATCGDLGAVVACGDLGVNGGDGRNLSEIISKKSLNVVLLPRAVVTSVGISACPLPRLRVIVGIDAA